MGALEEYEKSETENKWKEQVDGDTTVEITEGEAREEMLEGQDS